MRIRNLFLIFLFVVKLDDLSAQKDTIFYVGDPLCSWCYGFSNELSKVKDAFPNVPFKLILGGLRPNGQETMGELKEFLWHHWKEVQTKTGQPFNFAILNESSLFYDTEPACRAVYIAKIMRPGSEWEYFKAIQERFYYYNDSPNLEDTYAAIASKLGFDQEQFLDNFRSSYFKRKVYEDFELANNMGVNGFPTVIAFINGKYYQVCSGYEEGERLIKRLKGKGLK